MPYYRPHNVKLHFWPVANCANLNRDYGRNDTVPYDGIYGCNVCDFEVILSQGTPFPPDAICRDHRGTATDDPTPVRWCPRAIAQTDPDKYPSVQRNPTGKNGLN